MQHGLWAQAAQLTAEDRGSRSQANTVAAPAARVARRRFDKLGSDFTSDSRADARKFARSGAARRARHGAHLAAEGSSPNASCPLERTRTVGTRAARRTARRSSGRAGLARHVEQALDGSRAGSSSTRARERAHDEETRRRGLGRDGLRVGAPLEARERISRAAPWIQSPDVGDGAGRSAAAILSAMRRCPAGVGW
jgi:hypothetical protein